MKLLFNIGGTRTRIATSGDGVTLSEVITLETADDFEKGMAGIKNAADKLLGRDKISEICGGIAGVLDEGKNKLVKSPNLKDWLRKPLRKTLEDEFGAKAWLLNDATLEGLGEAKMGAGRHQQNVAYLSIGTGIGGVKIEDGKISPATWGFEPGHMLINMDKKLGYWEDFASGKAMEQVYGCKPEELKNDEAWASETRLLSIGIHNIIVLWSPEIVVLGGGVVKALNLDLLKANIDEELEIFPKMPVIVKSELGEKSGLYGALAFLASLNPGY